MKISNKLLHPYEQSLLLVAMLFSRNQLDEILSLFPDEQIERIENAKIRFLRLEKNERITQIILELRRLLLTKENKIAWIHPTWIADELTKEPPYLRELLNDALKSTNTIEKKIIPQSILVQNFVPAIINTPPKVAIFDPALMRLQAINENNVTKVMSAIGLFALSLLGESLEKNRFKKYIEKKLSINFIDKTKNHNIKNPFHYKTLRSLLLQNLIQRDSIKLDDIGLFIVAAYLFFHKIRWHRAIELALPKYIGLDLRKNIAVFSKLEPELKPILAKMMINGMDDAFV